MRWTVRPVAAARASIRRGGHPLLGDAQIGFDDGLPPTLAPSRIVRDARHGAPVPTRSLMPRIAIISDIHGNIVAFERVCADIRARGVDMVVCLGDVVGYGPDPKDCLDLARQVARVILLGNHEEGVLCPAAAATWNSKARAGIELARTELAGSDLSYLATLPRTCAIGSTVHATHDSPLSNGTTWDYIRSRADAAGAFTAADHPITLVGHTHVAACYATIVEHGFQAAAREVNAYPVSRALCGIAGEKRHLPVGSADFEIPRFARVILNPGSVGQPRDGDNRASYAILDLATSHVEYRRVSYDLSKVRERFGVRGLPAASAERLALGA